MTAPEEVFLGESPPLPPSFIDDLRRQVSDRLWSAAANAAANLFEAWRRG
jgi:hypothetical protein